jgi:Zn-dependent peptidase ImmA (M78 family)
MRWVTDRTGRFPQRPHYEPRELDHECEQIVLEFLKNKYSEVKFPISTDDMTILIEHDTSHLDLYADLSNEGQDIEGVTDFFPDKKPAVRIAEDLSLQNWRENRLRTTLMHEYGHVKLHAFLWDFNRPRLFVDSELARGPRCRRETILNALKTDWMEWQAGYASGSLLMPITNLRGLVGAALRDWGLYKYLPADSDEAQVLIKRTVEMFNVSSEAARVRLSQLGYLSKLAQTASIFDKQEG